MMDTLDTFFMAVWIRRTYSSGSVLDVSYIQFFCTVYTEYLSFSDFLESFSMVLCLSAV